MSRILRLGALLLASVLTSTCKFDELVTPQPPGTLTVSSAAVVDSAAVGSRPVRTVALGLSATGQGALAWAASRVLASSWLSLSAATGTTPDSLRVSMDPAGLLVGTYQDTVVLTQTGGGLDPIRIPVSFSVHACRDQPVTLGGAPVADSLTPADCEAPHRDGRFARLFAFSGLAGDSVSVIIRSATFRPYVILDSVATGETSPLAEAGSCGGDTTAACLSYVLLTRAGSFVVEVTSQAAEQTGPFTIAVSGPRVPASPATMAQLLPDSATPIPTGGAAATSSFVARAQVTDPDETDTLRLEVELRPVGTPFSGSATAVGEGRAGNGTAAVSVGGLTDNTAYHWQARTRDQTGRSSAWVPFGGNAETVPDFQVTVPQAPQAPASLDQRLGSGASVPVGGSVEEALLTLRATVSDADPGDRIRLEVEVQPVGVPFTNTANASSAGVASGEVAVATVSGLLDNSAYHWHARAVDLGGLASPWVSFGGNAESAADFAVAIPEPPAAPTGLTQFAANGTTGIAQGDSARSTSVVLKAAVTDPDPGASLRLQVEVRPVGTDFDDIPTHVGAAAVASGATASVTVGSLTDDTDYHWQGRALDETGRTGPWVAFGDNAETDTDFRVHLPATQLAFLVQPTDARTDEAISPPVQVEARKASGVPDPAFTGDVTVALVPGTGKEGADLEGTLTRAAVAGVATFDDLSVDSKANGYQMEATAAGLTSATSAPFNIMGGSAAQLVFAQPPGNVTAGAAVSPAVTVEARDGEGNVVTEYDTPIGLTLGANPGGATLSGGAAVVPVAGVATFAGLSLDKAGSGYTVVASSGGLSETSASFDVTPGAATKVAFLQGPSDVQAGQSVSPNIQVAVQDAFGNTVTTSSASVDLALGTAPPGATLGGTTSMTASAGVATFPTVNLTAAANGYTLEATSEGLTSATSSPFDVTPGPADSLVFQVQPSDAVAGEPIVPEIEVLVEDAYGNPVSNAVTSVTVTIDNNPGGGMLTGTATRNTVSGVARFDDLEINSAGGGYTLEAAGAELVATSDAFDVVAGTGSKLNFFVQPSGAVTGQVIAPAIQVEILDPQNNRDPTATDLVTLSSSNADPDGTLSVQAIDGVATFDNVSISAAGTGFTLIATGLGLLPTTSTPFDITRAATTTTITGNTPSTSVTGQGIVVTYTVAVLAPGSGTPTGNLVVTDGTDVCSVATVSGGSCTLVPTTAGTKTITATFLGSDDFTGSTSAGVSQTVDSAATTLDITSDPPDPSVTGQPVSVNYELTVPFPGSGTPTGTVTVTAGVDQCAASPAAGTCQLTFTSVGAKTITATYGGDPNFKGDVRTEPHTVSPASTEVTILGISPDSSSVADSVTVSYNVTAAGPGSGTPTGDVTVSDGAGAECTATVAAGSCKVAFGTAGTKTLTASYVGDGNFLGDDSPSVAYTVTAAATSTTITEHNPDPSAVGQAVTVSFTVASGAGTPAGTVSVTDGTDSCSNALAGGAGSCDLVLTTAGARTLTATYQGNGDFALSASPGVPHTVTPASTVTTITGSTPDTSVVGQSVTFSFTVTSAGGTPTGSVTVTDGTEVCVGTLTAGAGTCTIPLGFTSAGTRNMTATYADADDPSFAGSTSAVETHEVNKAATTTSIGTVAPPSASIGQQVTVNFGVAVNAPGFGTPSGMVTVTDNVDSCTGTRVEGNCKITFSTAGAKTLTATYEGNDDFESSTSAGTPYTVTGLAATAIITSDLSAPSVVGEPVSITFTVTSDGGAPSGDVTVSDGTQSCVGALSAGAGNCSITFATPGLKSLVATYGGDPQFTLATSAAVPHTVAAFGAADSIRAVSDLTPGGTAGGEATPSPTVIVVDAFGNPVEGTTVTFVASGTGSVTVGATATDATGVATAGSWTLGTIAGPDSDTLTSTVADVGSAAFVATAAPGPADGGTSTIDASPDSIALAGAATITVQLRDANGNALTAGGDAVVLQLDTGGSLATLSGVTDNGDGTHQATLTSLGLLPGTVTITGTVNGQPIADSATVELTLV